MKKKILITGGRSKFIPDLLKLLDRSNFEIALLTKTSNLSFSEKFDHQFNIDLSQDFNLDFFPDIVIHLAASVPYNNPSAFKLTKDEMIVDNLLSALNLLQFGIRKNVKKIIYISTTDVYPLLNEAIITEETLVCPNGAYGCSKLACERLFNTFKNIKKIPITILRLGPVYGEGMHSSLFISRTLEDIKLNRKVSLANANNILSLLSIEDASNAIYKSIFGSAGLYNIAGNPVTIEDFIKDKFIKLGFLPNIEYLMNQSINTKIVFDLSKAKEFLNWEPSEFNS